jgi:hypothetical protein
MRESTSSYPDDGDDGAAEALVGAEKACQGTAIESGSGTEAGVAQTGARVLSIMHLQHPHSPHLRKTPPLGTVVALAETDDHWWGKAPQNSTPPDGTAIDAHVVPGIASTVQNKNP